MPYFAPVKHESFRCLCPYVVPTAKSNWWILKWMWGWLELVVCNASVTRASFRQLRQWLKTWSMWVGHKHAHPRPQPFKSMTCHQLSVVVNFTSAILLLISNLISTLPISELENATSSNKNQTLSDTQWKFSVARILCPSQWSLGHAIFQRVEQ